MFQLLNISAIWHLCQCVNHWLWNSSKWPFTGAVLQSASQTHRPARPLRWSDVLPDFWHIIWACSLSTSAA